MAHLTKEEDTERRRAASVETQQVIIALHAQGLKPWEIGRELNMSSHQIYAYLRYKIPIAQHRHDGPGPKLHYWRTEYLREQLPKYRAEMKSKKSQTMADMIEEELRRRALPLARSAAEAHEHLWFSSKGELRCACGMTYDEFLRECYAEMEKIG